MQSIKRALSKTFKHPKHHVDPDVSSASGIMIMPSEIMQHIFSFVDDAETFMNVALTCLAFADVVRIPATTNAAQTRFARRVWGCRLHKCFEGYFYRYYLPNGWIHGIGESWSKGGHYIARCYWKADKQHGPYEMWDYNGNRIYLSTWVDGQRHGLEWYWHNHVCFHQRDWVRGSDNGTAGLVAFLDACIHNPTVKIVMLVPPEHISSMSRIYAIETIRSAYEHLSLHQERVMWYSVNQNVSNVERDKIRKIDAHNRTWFCGGSLQQELRGVDYSVFMTTTTDIADFTCLLNDARMPSLYMTHSTIIWSFFGMSLSNQVYCIEYLLSIMPADRFPGAFVIRKVGYESHVEPHCVCRHQSVV